MVGNDTQPAPVSIKIKAPQFAERKYIILVVLTTLFILLVLEEAIRTGIWVLGISYGFYYMNPRNPLAGSSGVAENSRTL